MRGLTLPNSPPSGQVIPMVYVTEPPVWEYKTVTRAAAQGPLSDAELDGLGRDGWELAGILGGKTLHFFFKRLAR